LKIVDIVPAATREELKSEWRLVTEASDDKGNSALAKALSGLMKGEIAGWRVLFERASIVGPKELPPANRHGIDENNGIWELIKGNYRVLFFYDEGKVVVCSHIFRKKRQKTPVREITRAIRLKERYETAIQNGTLTQVKR